jgi:hypothetical protein
MIGHAVALLELHKQDTNFHWLSDDLLLAALANAKVATALSLKITKDAGARAEAEAIGRLVEQRRLYKLAYLGVADDDVSFQAQDIYARWGTNPDARRELEAELASRAGLAPGRVLVHLPSPKMMAKLAKVRVLLEETTVTTFEDWEARHSERVQALNRAHARLWRVGVYCIPTMGRKTARRGGSCTRPHATCSTCRRAMRRSRSTSRTSRPCTTSMSPAEDGRSVSATRTSLRRPRPRRRPASPRACKQP